MLKGYVSGTMNLVLFMIFCKCVFSLSDGQEYFNITRRSSTNSQDYADVFQIPSSFCGESKGATECPLMGGRKTADCQCVCDIKDDKNITYKSTFGFYDGRWKCENKTVVHRHAGCSLLLYNIDVNGPIPTIQASRTNYFSFLDPDNERRSGCFSRKWLRYNTTYLECDGTWAPLDHTKVYIYTVVYGRAIIIYNRLNQMHSLLAGRIIRLVLQCDAPSIPPQCLLLRVKGKLNCPVSSIRTASPSTQTSSLSSSLPTTYPLSSLHTSLKERYTLLTLAPWTTSIADASNSATDSISSSSPLDPIWLIAGSVTVFIIVIVIIIVIVMRRRKRSNKDRKIKKKSNTDIGLIDKERPEGGEVCACPFSTFATPLENRSGRVIHGRRLSHQGEAPNGAYYVNVNIVASSSSFVSPELIYEVQDKQNVDHKSMDSSLYGSLVGNDPHVYGSLNIPHKTPEDVGGHVTCTLPNKEGTYQQLNPVGQRCDGEYQALSYNNETNAL